MARRVSQRSSGPRGPARTTTAWRDEARQLRPMLATLAESSLDDPRLVYEPKYDGIRALVELDPEKRRVVLWSRLGNDKTAQFPELVQAFETMAGRVKVPLILDGEIVALDEAGEPAGFQRLQGRMHLTGRADISRAAKDQPAAFVAFDLLRDDQADVRALSLTERRARLEKRLRPHVSSAVRLSESVAGDGSALQRRAIERDWEGLIAKQAESPYETGRRSLAWRKLKLPKRQEFVVGGWTEPRQSRTFFGALLLGVYEGNRLQYVGHTGSGFSQAELARVSKLLARLATETCPFATRPKGNEQAHWVRPVLVAEVRFTEWTSDGKLRHPIYLGLRDDVVPERVKREGSADAGKIAPAPAPKAVRPTAQKAKAIPTPSYVLDPTVADVVAQLRALEEARKDGVLTLPGDHRLRVTNLRKIFWPELGITKGDLMRFYAIVSPFLLPAVADRPLVMKRFPNGIAGKAFYQQRVRDVPPEDVRIEILPDEIEPIDDEDDVEPRRIVGGSLTTLLYMTQMAAISQDPWFSRVQSAQFADHAALDLDPMEAVPFTNVLDVARWVRDELARLDVAAVPKTSGSRGLHIYVPLAPGTPYESGMIFCQIVATLVASKHPRIATVTRSVAARGRTVYVDYLQNILGKTLATAYSARASDYAGVSTPLTWAEVDEGIDPRDFTIRTTPDRLRAVGDLWARLRTSTPVDLRRVMSKLK